MRDAVHEREAPETTANRPPPGEELTAPPMPVVAFSTHGNEPGLPTTEKL
eukprot:CAMPEP_0181343392 /NCGR_PEP_ID=MMETSP1101-20121128/31562_1 /TAXON_ID=46948 /ORGANISM="Rhodomonas abbreviata, Strain Caron Lab Isolate" /LENGTH=49 /DNA_ID= /DNA_START= /DNA_END= /DNA_ORIENTATION=